MKNASNPTVALNAPQPVAPFMSLARLIVQLMTLNKVTFPAPTPTLAQVTTDTDALATAEAAIKLKTGTVAVRDEKRVVVAAELRALRLYVQGIVNASPDHAAVIAQAAGMTLRKTGSHTKSELTAKPHSVSGSVELAAKAAAVRASNDWQYSLDGKTWISAPSSLAAKTTISNLQTGVVAYFRHRSVPKAGPGEWSQPVSVLVS